MKKLLALCLSLAMVLALGVTAMAVDPADYSITINGARENETYTAYKMFDLSVDDPTDPTAYRYTVNSAWADFADTDEFKAVYTVDELGYVTSDVASTTTWNGENVLSIVADAAAKYAAENGLPVAGQVTIDEGATSGTIALTEAGYYVIASTLGTRAMIETTPDENAVTVNEKNSDDTIEKEVKEDSTGEYGEENDAQVGDTVEFKSTATIVPRSINVVIHDTMTEGLTLNPTSIKVYTDEGLTTEYADAEIKTGNNADDGDTFTIVIPDEFAATANENQKLYIVYTAEVNSAAIDVDANGVAIVDQENKTKVTFGDGTSSTEDKTETTTHDVEIYKHAGEQEENLADAVFQLKKNGVVVNLVKIDANNYRIVDDTETTAPQSHANNGEINEIDAGTIVSDFVTVDDGNIKIWGLDSDDDYTLKEIQAPKGYNLLAEEVALVYDSGDNSFAEADITNNTGIELPSTGGIGTTIFYVVGGLMVAVAGVMLITKKRMSREG
ncbi:MAG: LPXTG cell wall anchor domain-containing protein [Ruminococcaceae bacterium]|jgi:LPXTG-motif cell wall-anchored protein|nr:LPXTG cell wall anchor domain-containing protein [Oscillospiraceae bacterium]